MICPSCSRASLEASTHLDTRYYICTACNYHHAITATRDRWFTRASRDGVFSFVLHDGQRPTHQVLFYNEQQADAKAASLIDAGYTER